MSTNDGFDNMFGGARESTPPTPEHVLKGPADADHYRVKVGRYNERWYTDPLPGCDIAPAISEDNAVWPSVSTIKGASGKDWTFVGLKRVALALEVNPNALKDLDLDDRQAALNGMNKKALRLAQNRGTNIHWYMECGLRGQPIEVRRANEPGAEYLGAVRAWFATYQPKLIAAEIVFVHRGLNGIGYGGTGDGIIEIDGKTYMIDWKSRGADSDHGAYPEEAAQIAAYAGAEYMIVEGENGPERRPVPKLDGGLIISIRPDGMREYPIDLSIAGDHFARMHSWWVARRDERKAIGRPWMPRKTVEVSVPVPEPVVRKSASQIADEIRVAAAPAKTADPVLEKVNQLLADIAVAPDGDALVELWAANKTIWNQSHTKAAQARKKHVPEHATAAA